MSRTGKNIYKRKDGRWEARYIKSYENGRAKYGYLYAKSYSKAREKQINALSNKEMGKANINSTVYHKSSFNIIILST